MMVSPRFSTVGTYTMRMMFPVHILAYRTHTIFMMLAAHFYVLFHNSHSTPCGVLRSFSSSLACSHSLPRSPCARGFGLIWRAVCPSCTETVSKIFIEGDRSSPLLP